MSSNQGQAARSTREMASKRYQLALWAGIIGLVLVLILFLLVKNAKVFGIGGIGILILLILTKVVSNLTKGRIDTKLKEEKRAIRGALGEEKIDTLLEGLSDDYLVLNDIESPNGNIDHLVIGKNSGIFLLETKAHGGKVEVNGETFYVNGKLPEKDFISQTLRNTYWLREEISHIVGSKPWITPIIVFTNAFVPQTNPIKNVSIINKKYLLSTISSLNKVNPVNTQIWEQRERINNQLI
jgi:hypothetical protein